MIKCPTLDFGSGHDLTVHEFESLLGLCADSNRACLVFSLSLPLYHFSHSQNTCKFLKNKKASYICKSFFLYHSLSLKFSSLCYLKEKDNQLATKKFFRDAWVGQSANHLTLTVPSISLSLSLSLSALSPSNK